MCGCERVRPYVKCMTTNNEELTFITAAMSYRSSRAAADAYERMFATFSRSDAGGSIYRLLVEGIPTVVVLSWKLDDAHLTLIASLPWGDGTPIALRREVTQQLAQRSVEVAPARPDTIRRIQRDPAGRVIRDHEFATRS